jgi:hypothetical protein
MTAQLMGVAAAGGVADMLHAATEW